MRVAAGGAGAVARRLRARSRTSRHAGRRRGPGETGEFTLPRPERARGRGDRPLEVFLPDGVPVEAAAAHGLDVDEDRAAGSSWTSGVARSRPGAREDFKVRLGPLPDRPALVFKALQYYADGQVVRWIQDPTADAERPAAVLDLGGGADGHRDRRRFGRIALAADRARSCSSSHWACVRACNAAAPPRHLTRVQRSDAALLAAARTDPGAFRELYDRYAERVLATTTAAAATRTPPTS